MTYRGTAYGLNFISEIELPELLARDRPGSDHDIFVELASLPDPADWNARQIGPLIWSSPTALMFEVPGIAKYLISDGCCIRVERIRDADDRSVRLFLLGSALGALLAQRGLFVLHASAVEIDGMACLAVGPSGVGKSTLAEGLRRRGHPMLADDVVAIDADGMALPGLARVKLWRDVAERLGIDRAPAARIRPGLEKYAIRTDETVALGALPMRWIYELGAHHGTTITVKPINGVDAFALLRKNVYRSRFLNAIKTKAEQLRMVNHVASCARVAAISRPIGHFSLEAMVDAILTDARQSR